MSAGRAAMSAWHHVLLCAVLTASAASALVTAAPAGQFVVVAAPRHPAVTNMQAAFRSDDPQLVGRLVAFDGPAASFDGNYKSCARTTSTTAKMTADHLFRRIFPDRVKYGKRYVARPSDFGLTITPSATVAATSFRCAVPRGNHGDDWTGATLFLIGKGRYALAIIQDHLLILKPAIGPIRASFGCAQAKSLVEQTMCGDRLLAGWDRSVAMAYEQGNGDQAGQRAWLAERDKCGADKACLHDSMSLRASNLLH